MKPFFVVLFLSLALLVGSLGFVYSGLYPIGADTRHSQVVYWLLETLRKRSVARASQDIVVPPLDDPNLLLQGGPDYNEMCSGCHLKPGKLKSDMSIGLYPTPPNLTSPAATDGHEDHAHDNAAETFWIIKHGIKASGMPAWGPTHDDQRIWAMVAFINRLPDLNAAQYQILTTRDASEAAGHH